MEEVTTNGMEFYFPRDRTDEFQTAFGQIREHNNIHTAFVVRYLFDGDNATAIVPDSAAKTFTKEQILHLQSI
jgi:hypothetical protein